MRILVFLYCLTFLCGSVLKGSIPSDTFNCSGAGLLFPTKKRIELPDTNEVVINYILQPDAAYALIITEAQQEIVKLGDPDTIKTLIKLFREEFIGVFRDQFPGHKKIATQNYQRIAAELYQLLLRPIEESGLIENKALIIIPHEELFFIPFESLIVENRPEEKHPVYLVERYAITYYPSYTTMNAVRKFFPGRRDKRKILVFADPIYSENQARQHFLFTTEEGFWRSSDSKRFTPLPGSKREAKAIQQYFPDATLFLSENATEDQLKALNKNRELSQYDYIHFATHSWIENNPKEMGSSLVLTQDNNPDEDGFLRLEEIRELDLNVQLVVLSACETGLGRLVPGEGVEGFMESFLIAGTSSVMLSLWEIDDRAAAYLFTDYYERLRTLGKAGKYAALREVQLMMIKSETEYSHPFFWAPFIFIGEKG